jgi:hypothetical protein
MDTEKAKKIIEKIEWKNHSGSGKRAGVFVEASNIRIEGDKVLADINIKGPEKDEVRDYKDKSYSYKYIFG